MSEQTAQAAQQPPVNKWLVTVSITFGTLMGAIDASIVNVAVPHLTGGLGVTIEQVTWVTTGFVIATVMVMPLTGFLARLFGQKRVYMFSLVLFVAGSALCGMARTLPLLVVFRVLQGLGAGALQPTEQAILRQTFPPKEQGMAMALFGMAVVLGPAFGPTLGGYIVDNYSWPWIFYINVPIGAISLLMVSRFVHEPEDVRAALHTMAVRQRKNMDWARIALAFGILLFAYTAWIMGHYTLSSSVGDVVYALILQGIAFSCLFIPLTTMALSTTPRHRLSDATGLNSLLRQTGGSVGLAIFATMMSRFATRARDGMLGSMSPQIAATRIAGIKSMLTSRGLDPIAAQSTAAQILDGQLRQQAMVISFERLFYLAGILFLLVLPLVFFLRLPKDATPAEVHMEM